MTEIERLLIQLDERRCASVWAALKEMPLHDKRRVLLAEEFRARREKLQLNRDMALQK